MKRSAVLKKIPLILREKLKNGDVIRIDDTKARIRLRNINLINIFLIVLLLLSHFFNVGRGILIFTYLVPATIFSVQGSILRKYSESEIRRKALERKKFKESNSTNIR